MDKGILRQYFNKNKVIQGLFLCAFIFFVLFAVACTPVNNSNSTLNKTLADSSLESDLDSNLGKNSPDLESINGLGNALNQTKSVPFGSLSVADVSGEGEFNPLYAVEGGDINIAQLLFEGLISTTAEGLIEPQIASKWQFDQEKSSVVFSIRRDVVFSDGVPLTGNDVLYTYRTLQNKNYTGTYKALIQTIRDVELLDPYTIRIEFKDLNRHAFDVARVPILPRHYYGQFSVQDFEQQVALGITSLEPIGSGPYLLKQFEHNDFALLKRNNNYNRLGYLIEELTIKYWNKDLAKRNADQIDLALIKGDVDLVPESLGQLDNQNLFELGFSIYERPSSSYYALMFDCSSPDDTGEQMRLRQALSLAIDIPGLMQSEELKDDVFEQGSLYSPLSWASIGNLRTTSANALIIERAALLLDAEGWQYNSSGFREKNGLPLIVSIVGSKTDLGFDSLIKHLKLQWTEKLGIQLVVNADTPATMRANYQLLDFKTQDPGDLDGGLYSHLKKWCNFSNVEVASLMNLGNKILNIPEAQGHYMRAQSVIWQNMPLVPLWSPIERVVHHPKLKKYFSNAFYSWPLALKQSEILP